MIPIVEFRSQYRLIRKEVEEALCRVLESGWYLLGEELRAFEAEFAAWVGVKEAVGVHSGTEALALALRALDIGSGDEVITTPLTAVYTAYAISSVGATPVFADINLDDCQLSPEAVAAKITRRTRAIIPVHLYGYPCEAEALVELARSRGLKVIEDCAQAHGAKIKGKPVGTFGDVGCFSFYPTKNLGACGDGGMVVTEDSGIAERVRLLRNGGLYDREKYLHETVALHSRLSELQAAILRVKLRYLDEWNKKRCFLADRYREGLAGLPLSLPPTMAGREPVYHLFVIRLESRDALQKYLKKRQIGSQVHYPALVPFQPAYAHLGLEKGSFPNAERVVGKILSLPMYPELEEGQVEKVCKAVRDFFKRGK